MTVPSDSLLRFYPQDGLGAIYDEEDLTNLLEKLDKDLKVLNLIYAPYSKHRDIEEQDYYYELSVIQPDFDKYFAEVKNKLAESKFDIVYEITYTASREVLLNKIVQLAKPDFDSVNDVVFNFLYKNPNKQYTKKALEQATGKAITNLHKVVEQLGFIGQLRDVFISVSKDTICFRNPITKMYLERKGMIRIEPIIKPKKA